MPRRWRIAKNKLTMGPIHGGDLTGAEAQFGKPRKGWLDLSTAINAIPYEVRPDLPLNWDHLPTKGEQLALIQAARAYYDVPKSAFIAASPGTQAIIQWLPRLREQSKVHVVSPTYAEHAYCWRAAGHSVRETSNIEDADVVVIVNPNNPTGRTLSAEKILAMAEYQDAKGGWLVVDEAFADVVPSCTAVEYAGTPGLLILKSFGKFFGLPGVRLGFLIGELSVASELEAALGPWAISGPAIAAGIEALNDHNWQETTMSHLTDDADRMDMLLTSAGLEIIGGTPLFRLADVSDANALYEKLGRQGILVRKFDAHPTWIRFGIPGPESDWERLESALNA